VTNEFWLTSLPSMGKLLTPIEPSWKATFSFNSPHCKYFHNYNPFQTQSLGQNFLEFFCMAIMYCSNLSNWKLTYNIVKVVISFCKQMFIIVLIYIVHVMVAFGLGQFFLETFFFFLRWAFKSQPSSKLISSWKIFLKSHGC
jgi:hypothetical protein